MRYSQCFFPFPLDLSHIAIYCKIWKQILWICSKCIRFDVSFGFIVVEVDIDAWNVQLPKIQMMHTKYEWVACENIKTNNWEMLDLIIVRWCSVMHFPSTDNSTKQKFKLSSFTERTPHI